MDRLPWDNPGKILLALADRDFNDDEYRACVAVFGAAGFETSICSARTGWITGSFGMRIPVGATYRDVDPAVFSAVVFIGGDGAGRMAGDAGARRLAVDAGSNGCVVGAICAAPLVLGRAGMLEMRRATCHPSCLDELTGLGAVPVDLPVVAAGWIVTASGPSHAGRFADAIVALVRQKESAPADAAS